MKQGIGTVDLALRCGCCREEFFTVVGVEASDGMGSWV